MKKEEFIKIQATLQYKSAIEEKLKKLQCHAEFLKENQEDVEILMRLTAANLPRISDFKLTPPEVSNLNRDVNNLKRLSTSENIWMIFNDTDFWHDIIKNIFEFYRKEELVLIAELGETHRQLKELGYE